MSALPPPSAEALAHCARVAETIHARIDATGGWIPFAQFMELALYAPGLGYYAAGAAKFGAAGDFVTAPELTPLFGRTLARSVAAMLADTGGEVLELGAGSGRLAVDLLLELEQVGQLPGRYSILDLSADLRERQRETIRAKAPHLLDRVHWLDALPDRFDGIVLGNEVLDALPVHLIHWTDDGVMERGVGLRPPAPGGGLQFAWLDRPIKSGRLGAAAATLPVRGDYLSEINLAASALIASLAGCLQRGVLLFIDYGFPRTEYYHPQRHMGTLRAHYRHHALDDPFLLPGLCDLTAHVDFSSVAEAGRDAGLDLLGYTSQASWLLDAGLIELMQALTPMTPAYLRAASAVQKLVQPQEMGELFKVIALGRGVGGSLPGFRRGDRRGAL